VAEPNVRAHALDAVQLACAGCKLPLAQSTICCKQDGRASTQQVQQAQSQGPAPVLTLLHCDAAAAAHLAAQVASKHVVHQRGLLRPAAAQHKCKGNSINSRHSAYSMPKLRACARRLTCTSSDKIVGS
jgi:hypothetical protein